LLKKRKKKRFVRRPAFWLVSLLIIAAFASGWFLWRGIYIPFTPRFNCILVSINQEPKKIRSGETLPLHPGDKVKILKISTNVPLNLGVRISAVGFDVNSLRYEEISISTLLPHQQIFDHHRFRVHVKYRNQEFGHTEWEIQPYAEDWLAKADRTIKGDQRLVLLERALQLLPEDKRIWQRLLNEYKSLKQWGKAAAMLEDRAKKKLDRETLIELLEVYTAMQSNDGLLAVLNRLVKLDPSDISARTRLAETSDQIGKKKEAIEQYEALLSLVQEGDRLEIYKRLGYLYTERGQNKKAISYYLKAVKLDQKDANLHYNLSYLYEKTNQVEKADFYLSNAVALKSEDVENRLKLAKRLINKKDLKKAEHYLSQILKEKPDLLDALLVMAQLLEKQGKSRELKDIYKKIISIEPRNETVIYNLGILEYEAGNLSASLKLFERYVRSHPKDVTVHRILFDIYKKQKNDSLALKEAQTLIEISPKEISPYYYMFNYLNAKGDYENIVSFMEKGIKANPQQTDLRDYLLLAYLKTGKELLAIKQLEEILKVRPRDIGILLPLARLQEKHGKFAEALGAYRRIIEISPGHEEAEEAYLRLRLGSVKGGGAK
jgi:tetratricopeptide (TPR) repeat protein